MERNGSSRGASRTRVRFMILGWATTAILEKPNPIDARERKTAPTEKHETHPPNLSKLAWSNSRNGLLLQVCSHNMLLLVESELSAHEFG